MAEDAQGAQVPTRYRIEPSRLVVELDHRAASYAYPIKLDPYILDNYAMWRDNAGIGIPGGWAWGTGYPGWSASMNGAWGRGLYTTSVNGNSFAHTSSAWWAYQAPNQSHAYAAWFFDVINQPSWYAVGCMTEGYYNNNYNNWEQNSAWIQAGGSQWITGAFVNCNNWLVNDSKLHCARAGCPESAGEPRNQVGFQNWMYGDGIRDGQASITYLAGAHVYLADNEDPWINIAAPSTVGDPNSITNFTVGDPGLGVKRVQIYSNGNPIWDGANDIPFNCYGTAWSPCPASALNASIRWGNIPYGLNNITVAVTDAGGKLTRRDFAVNVTYYAQSMRYGGGDGRVTTTAELESARAALEESDSGAQFTQLFNGFHRDDRDVVASEPSGGAVDTDEAPDETAIASAANDTADTDGSDATIKENQATVAKNNQKLPGSCYNRRIQSQTGAAYIRYMFKGGGHDAAGHPYYEYFFHWQFVQSWWPLMQRTWMRGYYTNAAGVRKKDAYNDSYSRRLRGASWKPYYAHFTLKAKPGTIVRLRGFGQTHTVALPDGSVLKGFHLFRTCTALTYST